MATQEAVDLEKAIAEAADSALASVGRARAEIGRVIFGQQEVVDLALIAVLSGGHALLVGLPGLAKTRLVEAMGSVLGLNARRVQFTPDLMPSDILGAEVLDETADGKRHFRFLKGPVFTQLLMADEINRASPRTQSALLQAMQEHHVTIAGERHDLPKPFHVLATQNPIEQEGTYPLPEAQLDRFLMQIDVGYPDRDSEAARADRDHRGQRGQGRRGDDRRAAPDRAAAGAPPAGRRPGGRGHPRHREGGAARFRREGRRRHARLGRRAPRQPVSGAAVRARALLQGRLAPSVDDVAALAAPVLKHRLALTFAARADGGTVERVVSKLTERLG